MKIKHPLLEKNERLLEEKRPEDTKNNLISWTIKQSTLVTKLNFIIVILIIVLYFWLEVLLYIYERVSQLNDSDCDNVSEPPKTDLCSSVSNSPE